MRRWERSLVVVLSVVALALFLAAPVALMITYAGMADADVDRMSQIGQAYGGLSALLSGAATLGVVIALVMQTRQLRMSQAQGARMMQIELMKILIEHPEVRPHPPLFAPDRPDQHKRDIFTNLMYRHLEYGYEIGYLSAEEIRRDFAVQFSVPDVRRWWSFARDHLRSATPDGTRRRVFEIADAACAEAEERARSE